jgi:hypothetical protein
MAGIASSYITYTYVQQDCAAGVVGYYYDVRCGRVAVD